MPTVFTGGTPTFPDVFLLHKNLGSLCYSGPISTPAAHIKPILPAVPSDVTMNSQPRTYVAFSFTEVLPNLHCWPDPNHKLLLILRNQGPSAHEGLITSHGFSFVSQSRKYAPKDALVGANSKF